MVRRSTWILLAILVILVGSTLLFQRYQASKPENTATAIPSVALVNVYNLTGKQVSEVDLSDSLGNSIVFNLNLELNMWAIANTPEDQADSSQIESILAKLFALTARETLTQTPPLESIGLVNPAYTIHFITSGGEQINTAVGSMTPIGTGYYLRVNSDPVAIVDKLLLDNVLNMLTDPPLLATPTPEVTSTKTLSPAGSGFQKTPTP
jgi:hypothetical protein